jgi:hypothetical protein
LEPTPPAMMPQRYAGVHSGISSSVSPPASRDRTCRKPLIPRMCSETLLPLYQPPHPTVAVAQGDGESERRLTIIPLCGMGRARPRHCVGIKDVSLLSMSCRLSSLFLLDELLVMMAASLVLVVQVTELANTCLSPCRRYE